MQVLWKCLRRRQKGINSNNNYVSYMPSPVCGCPGQAINLLHPGKVIIWCPFSPTLSELLLREHAKMVDNFQRSYSVCGKSEFTSNIFPIIPVIS
jgi:hypothetical protein